MGVESRWTVDAILRVTKDFLASKGIESARLDAELLLCQVMGLTRVQLYTHYDRPISSAEQDTYRELVRRRATLEPVAYILGEKEFYGRSFSVGPGVLVPRPETEHLVDEVLARAKTESMSRVVDVGTGSGCVALTLASELPDVEVVATDISEQALEYARQNAARHGLSERVTFMQHDLVPSNGRFDAIVSNPPYIPEGDPRVQSAVRAYEPAVALYSGADGLGLIRRLVDVAPSVLRPGGWLALEIGQGQKNAIVSLLPGVQFVDDLQGIPRIAVWQAPAIP